MTVGRWYPTATELADGRVLVSPATTSSRTDTANRRRFKDASVNSLPEIYDPIDEHWTDLTGSKLTSPLYPFMFVLSNGRCSTPART